MQHHEKGFHDTGHEPSIIKESIDRFDSKMAIGESRRAAKQEKRAVGEMVWSFSTGKIHAYKTRITYQEQTLRFVNWARDEHQIKRLEDLDARADELASVYLRQQITDGKSAYTLTLIRSALRLFFSNNELASAVTLPKRERTKMGSRHFFPVFFPPSRQQ